MVRPVSLAHLTLLDATPLELIDAAAAAGFSHVGLRIVPPGPDPAWRSVIGDVQAERAIKQRLSDTGVKLLDVEAFWLGPETRVQDWKAALALGAGLGARYLVVICDDPDRSAGDRQLRQAVRAGRRVRIEARARVHSLHARCAARGCAADRAQRRCARMPAFSSTCCT